MTAAADEVELLRLTDDVARVGLLRVDRLERLDTGGGAADVVAAAAAVDADCCSFDSISSSAGWLAANRFG